MTMCSASTCATALECTVYLAPS
ncbi:hypothetical protein E2C01_089787 [Portunus trituberculatus]|uniref:Uncharacterized protein n=1 Tax=Portunus trituberculatus TaxID=210409 RepID=A0A5B7JCZ3_PORTR|nr:hypothetical protein [Portunus trituberculatus]